ncbi:MAG: glycosyltransferase [Pirellulales bacterium]|nr:glycosyltransferase [Pirellulales bacterium]
MDATCDVHVHSKHSDRPSEWILRRVGAPESFVEPLDLYYRAKERGMQFVTISDHNCIAGAESIAHLPDVFLSTEVTTYFPEDGCKIHCLVLGITPEQFEVIEALRENIYDFRRYVIEQDIVYSVAHPLFRVNNRLSVEHLERLLVLFNRFEGINGTRDGRACEISNAILSSLTAEHLDQLANRYEIEPHGNEPWRKSFTAGSDDHSGVYAASAWTITPPAPTVAEYLEHLRRGDHRMGGTAGTSLRLAHSFYQIASSYYKARFLDTGTGQNTLIAELFRKLLERPPADIQGSAFSSKLRSFAGWFVGAPASGQLSQIERVLVDEFAELFGPKQLQLQGLQQQPPNAADDQRIFHLANGISQQVGCAFLERFVTCLAQGRLMESLQTLSSLAPVALSIAPYLTAFHTQHKDERFLQAVARSFPATASLERKSAKKAWVTDTFQDMNGVARTIQTVAQHAQEANLDLTVLTCLTDEPDTDIRVHNFLPGRAFAVPEYDQQMLAIPPILEVIEYFERERFSEVIISTPGPLGLTALAAGRLLGLRIVGIYHSDFPQYVQHFTQDEQLEKFTWQYMHWFFGQMDLVLAPSRWYQEWLIEHGFPRGKLRLLRRGVDTRVFNPEHRDLGFWTRYGVGEGLKFLYVGRISPEKNLERLCQSFRDYLAGGHDAQLVLVGDGPAQGELSATYASQQIHFLGPLYGAELSRAYASGDVFVFPSTTDTFGNAVLEAQASGLPAIVSDRGGPPEIILPFGSGLVVNIDAPNELASAMRLLSDDAEMRATLRQRALENGLASSWRNVCDELWTASDALAVNPREFARIQRSQRLAGVDEPAMAAH